MYNEDLDYLILGIDISEQDISDIILTAEKIISEYNSSAEKRIEAYLKKVQCLQKSGEYDKSKEFIDRLLDFNPNMPEALVRLANIYDKNEEYDLAIESSSKAIAIKPDYAYAYYIRGLIYYGKEEYDKAIQDYTKAISCKANLLSAYLKRGAIYNNQSKYNKALKEYDKVLEFQPNNTDAYSGKGHAYLYKGDNRNAIKFLTKSIEIDHDSLYNYWLRSQAYENISEDEKALADIDILLDLEKDNKSLIREIKSRKYSLLAKINDEWEVTKKRFVLYFDIMGFKNFILKNNHEDVFNKMTLLLQEAKIHVEKNKYFIYLVTFSDSIVVFSRDDTIDSVKAIIAFGKSLMSSAMKQEMPVPIKGSIAYGNISVDKTNQIFCGQPIIDAFLFQEDQLCYYGVVFLHSFEKYFNSNKEVFLEIYKEYENELPIIEMKTPLKKGGSVNHLNLNWFSDFNNGFDFDDIISKLKITSGADGDIRKYIDNTIEIYMNIYPRIDIPSYKDKLFILKINSLLKEAYYKTWNGIKIEDYVLPFIAITFDADESDSDNSVLVIGDFIAPNTSNENDINILAKKLTNIDRHLTNLFDEVLDADLRIKIQKIILLKEAVDIEEDRVQEKLNEFNIILANLDREKNNYLMNLVPKSIVPNADNKEDFDAYSNFIETVIGYFK
jgi:tetratricopeptide (TPR) repeat protein